MPRSRRLSLVFAPLALACFACSLIVETEDIDAGCPTGQKKCGQICVGIDDPAYGCDQRCDPCQLINAIPMCEEGMCKVKACLYGFGCPTASGCETFVRLAGTSTTCASP